MTHIIYARVSTTEQDVDQQVTMLQVAYPQATSIYADKLSGKDMKRPEMDALLADVRAGDSIYFQDISRIGRNTADVLEFARMMDDSEVKVVVHSLGGVDITSPSGKMVMTVLASVATMQREEMLEKQAIGIVTAKAEGKYKVSDQQTHLAVLVPRH